MNAKSKTSKAVLTAAALLTGCVSGAAAHLHLNAGAQGSKLAFINGESFVEDSGFFVEMTLREEGRSFEGLYAGSLTFTALPASPLTGGPAPGHAEPGTVIAMQVESVDGPESSAWSFWDSGRELNFVTPTFSVSSGTTNGTRRILLSESSGVPGEDPFGHYHGRNYTVDKPGRYSVGLRLIDIGQNGPDGGPIHLPSDLFTMSFVAASEEPPVLEIRVMDERAHLYFSSKPNRVYRLQYSNDLVVWKDLAETAIGNGGVRFIRDEELLSNNEARYYRLIEEPELP